MSNLIATVTEINKETGRLPSQTIQNPRGNVSAVMLWNGKQLVDELEMSREVERPREYEEDPTGPPDAPQALGTTDLRPVPHSGLLGQDASQTLGPIPSAPAPGTSVPAPGTSAPAPGTSAPAPGTSGQVPTSETEPGSVPLPFPVPARIPKRYVMDKDVWDLFS
ncbi:unnamed protein product [Rhodiola kirilowii]